MKIDEIRDPDRWKRYTRSTGDKAYAENPVNHQIQPIKIGDRHDYFGKMYQVIYDGDPDVEGGYGMWAADDDEVWDSKEEGERAIFKRKLKDQRITEGFMPYTDEQKEFIQTIYDALPEDSYGVGVNNDLMTLHDGGLKFEVEVKQEDELQPAVDKIIEIARELKWHYNFSSVGHYATPLKARFTVMPPAASREFARRASR